MNLIGPAPGPEYSCFTGTFAENQVRRSKQELVLTSTLAAEMPAA